MQQLAKTLRFVGNVARVYMPLRVWSTPPLPVTHETTKPNHPPPDRTASNQKVRLVSYSNAR